MAKDVEYFDSYKARVLNRLRELGIRKGDYRGFAKDRGLPVRTFENLVSATGPKSIPRTDFTAKLAVALDVCETWLLGGECNNPTHKHFWEEPHGLEVIAEIGENNTGRILGDAKEGTIIMPSGLQCIEYHGAGVPLMPRQGATLLCLKGTRPDNGQYGVLTLKDETVVFGRAFWDKDVLVFRSADNGPDKRMNRSEYKSIWAVWGITFGTMEQGQ